MIVADVIGDRAPVSIDTREAGSLALQTMRRAGVRHLPVLDHGLLAGIVSETDLLGYEARRGVEGLDDPVQMMMVAPVIVASAPLDLAAARALMVDWQVGCLPVLAGRALLGVVTRSDVLRAKGR